MYIYVHIYICVCIYIFWWTEIFNFNKIQLITYFSFIYHSSGILQEFFSQVVPKNLTTSTGEARDAGSIPGSGSFPRGGHGNPLQYSCLENPKDRGAWQVRVHRVTKSQTQLKWLSMHANIFFLLQLH